MTLSLQSRVLALAGIGVFGAGAALSMLSRQSLLALDASLQEEQARAARFAASALARDVVADLQVLQGAVTSPRVQEPQPDPQPRQAALIAAARHLRLADGVCFMDAAGAPTLCEPESAIAKMGTAIASSTAREAIATGRPVISPFPANAGGSAEAVAVVPMPGGAGAAAAVVAAGGPRVRELLPAGTGATLESGPGSQADDDVRRAQARVTGTPWVVVMTEPASAEIATFRWRSLWIAPSLAGLAALMAWGVVLSVQRPVHRLTAAAERIAAGDLSQRIDGGTDEIGRLATALDHMREQLRRSMDAAELANAVLERRVKERTAQLARVLRAVISAQEEERRRVARELHDETSQLVAAMGMAIDSGGTGLRALVDRMHDGLHRLIVNLRPSVLDDLGLAAAIDWLAEHQLRRAGIDVRCELTDLQDCRADPSIEITVFRVVQESIVNIIRHAEATCVLIQGGLTDGRLWVEIEDDGRGFEPGEIRLDAGSLRGLGILGMRERVDLVGGTLTVDSAPGEGTRVRVETPVQIGEEAAV